MNIPKMQFDLQKKIRKQKKDKHMGNLNKDQIELLISGLCLLQLELYKESRNCDSVKTSRLIEKQRQAELLNEKLLQLHKEF